MFRDVEDAIQNIFYELSQVPSTDFFPGFFWGKALGNFLGPTPDFDSLNLDL